MSVNLPIPEHLITRNSREINYSLIHGKSILGLGGYARAGKDSVGQMFSERLGFKRIAFGDMLKQDLNDWMKNQVFEDLQNNGIDIKFSEIDFLNPVNIEIKEILRPYMVWFGEEMKKQNGVHHWTNRAFESIGDSKKVVITDVRRVNELEIFRNSSQFRKARIENRRSINLPLGPIDEEVIESDYQSMLFLVNQLNNKDNDALTTDTILTAIEEWLFDDTIYVDSRIPNIEDYQEKHLIEHIRKLSLKYPNFLI